MTIEEYLRGVTGYAIPQDTLKAILLQSNVVAGTEADSMEERQRDLVTAQCLTICSIAQQGVTSISDKDGDWSHSESHAAPSAAERNAMRTMAAALYAKWNVTPPLHREIRILSF
ncbi:MAG: hypothetical protein K6A98_06760 [Prevotella sp.]|nr:hypothetical protein [Prevotella sp.]